MAIFGVAPQGVQGTLFEVEVASGGRGTGIRIGGNIDKIVDEGATRISKALDASDFPVNRPLYEINLHPAATMKCGTSCDLPIALGILVHSQLLLNDAQDSGSTASRDSNVCVDRKDPVLAIDNVDRVLANARNEREETGNLLRWLTTENVLAVGELRFDATITKPRGIFGMLAVAAKARPFRLILVSDSAVEECRLLLCHKRFSESRIVTVDTLQSAFYELQNDSGNRQLQAFTRDALSSKSRATIDFRDIKAQATAKRAVEVAAAGGHNVLLIGPPGEGKTMLLKACSGILPPPTLAEIFDVNAVYSARGLLPDGEIKVDRPFREVPATASRASVFGGIYSGRLVSPGEISLAHHGVLIMDEMPQRDRSLLEELRTPMQDKEYTVAKYGESIRFPSNFIFLGAMNPCPCGFFGEFVCERCGDTILNLASGCSEHGDRFTKPKCTCSDAMVKRYQDKISGPLLDRIDITARVTTINVKERLRRKREEASSTIRKRVENARRRQRERFAEQGLANARCNADLSERVADYVKLTDAAKRFVQDRDGRILRRLSFRKFNQVLKVARTIADLESIPGVHKRHILEAVSMMGVYDDPKEYFVVDARNIQPRMRQELLRREIGMEQIAREAGIPNAHVKAVLGGEEPTSEQVESLSNWYWNSVEK